MKEGAILERVYEPPLDKGIERAVTILNDNGIETFESCEGGLGHAFHEPTIRFYGDKSEGFKALDIALKNGLKVSAIKRLWTVIDNEPNGAWWEMIF
jgi:hypothetical protein